jgi:hypothetical protein
MIHLVQAGAPFDDGKPDFFVNEVPDPLDLGDTLTQQRRGVRRRTRRNRGGGWNLSPPSSP